MEDLALLEDTVDDLIDNHPDFVVYIRGDSNASVVPRDKNTIDSLFQFFLSNMCPLVIQTIITSLMKANPTPILMFSLIPAVK